METVSSGRLQYDQFSAPSIFSHFFYQAMASSSGSGSSSDSSPAPIKALVLDFDSTISTPIFLKRANCYCVADNVALFGTMTQEEVIANLGGPDRVAVLAELLSALSRKGVVLHIVSIGHKAAILPHLRASGLSQFFAEERIWGQDCRELRDLSFVKGHLIDRYIMRPNDWRAEDVLFVDDSKDHIEKAGPICRTLLVLSKATVGGMSDYEFAAIRAAAGLGPA